jgi:hypothetical protein
VWIPGLRCAHPGMTKISVRCKLPLHIGKQDGF